MQRSVAVIIFNSESNEKDDLKTITDTFYRLNMTVVVLKNKTAKQIQDTVIELTEMDPDEILDILFVIHAKQVKTWDKKFSTYDRKIFDLYDNILFFLLEVEEFEDKPKIIIFKVCGCDNEEDLVPYKPEKKVSPRSYGLSTLIIWANNDNFITEFFKDLGENRNLLTATENKRSTKLNERIFFLISHHRCRSTNNSLGAISFFFIYLLKI